MIKQVVIAGVMGIGIYFVGQKISQADFIDLPLTSPLPLSETKSATATTTQNNTNTLTVTDQKSGPGIIINSANLAQQGFVMLLKTDESGNPTEMVGVSEAFTGLRTEIPIKLMESFKPGDQLFAMLHTDANTNGAFEWPGVDEPINDKDGLAIMQDFKLN